MIACNLEDAQKELANLKLETLSIDRRIENLRQENLKLKKENTNLKEKIIESKSNRA